MERILLLCIAAMAMSAEQAQAQTSGARRIHTLFFAECNNFFDWQTVGLMYSHRKAHQPGPITRLLICTEQEKRSYRGIHLTPTLEVPSISGPHKSGDWYPIINKPAGIVHWLSHSKDAQNVDWVIILDADMIIQGPILPWELGAKQGTPFVGHYGYSVGRDYELAKLRGKYSELCDGLDGLLLIHIDDLRALVRVWLSKTEEIRQDRAHWATKMEADLNKRKAPFLSIECINTLNEAMLLQHVVHDCPKPKWSKYLSFLRSKTKLLTRRNRQISEVDKNLEDDSKPPKSYPKIHTIFSTECSTYYDWQTVGLVHSFKISGQPGNITRLLSCTEEDLKQYKGLDLAPTHYVPSMSRHPRTGDWYPAIHKPAGVIHWLDHAQIDAEYIVILNSDMIMRRPITPWEFNAVPGRPVGTSFDYLIGCDTELAKIHTQNPEACDKVGGVIIIHIIDLRRLAVLWLRKTEELRAHRAHWSRNLTGDVYESGWISEMYGYSFAAAELNLRHVISNEILIYPGNVPLPGVEYRVFHYVLEFRVGNRRFDKARWRHVDLVNKCWAKFLDPPDESTLDKSDNDGLQRDLLSIECVNKLNEALNVHHKRKKCPNLTSRVPPSLRSPSRETTNEVTTTLKLGNLDETSRQHSKTENVSQEVLLTSVTNHTFTSMRFWIILLWAVAVFGFVVMMSAMLSSRKGQKRRSRSSNTKRRSSYAALSSMNAHDIHLWNT